MNFYSFNSFEEIQDGKQGSLFDKLRGQNKTLTCSSMPYMV